MLKTLINEAIIEVKLIVDSPLVIKSGQKNVLDPSLPDDQMIRSYKDGRFQEVIPGSSLKGAFRSRAERLLRGRGYEIDDPFAGETRNKYLKLPGDGDAAYKNSCPISKLFGSLGLRGRVKFSDAFPENPEEVKTGIRNGVGIDRVTGGSKKGALFDLEVVESGTFVTTISLENYELWQLSLILWLLKDLDEGHIRLGSATSRGFGKVKVDVANVKLHYYKNVNGEQPIHGYFDKDVTSKKVNWQATLLGATFEQGGLENWIGDDGLLKNVKLPQLSN